jgi:hypothetical protein
VLPSCVLCHWSETPQRLRLLSLLASVLLIRLRSLDTSSTLTVSQPCSYAISTSPCPRADRVERHARLSTLEHAHCAARRCSRVCVCARCGSSGAARTGWCSSSVVCKLLSPLRSVAVCVCTLQRLLCGGCSDLHCRRCRAAQSSVHRWRWALHTDSHSPPARIELQHHALSTAR